MKKLIPALLVLTSLYAQEGEDTTTFDSVFNNIKQDVQSANPSSEWALSAFWKRDVTKKIFEQIKHLPQNDKNRLMSEISAIELRNLDWTDALTILRDYLALTIAAGANPDTPINPWDPSTFLAESIKYSDLPAIEIALKFGATTNHKINSSKLYYPLQLAKTYPIAKILVEHHGLEPYFIKPYYQFDLVKNISNPDYASKIFSYYKDKGIDLNAKDRTDNLTALHMLCYRAKNFMPGQFSERFSILFNGGGVDLDARNSDNERPIDIITSDEDQNNLTITFAKHLLENLAKKPSVWKAKLKIS